MTYHDRSVLVTGGLGFIGSNLVIRLVELGAKVTIVDCSVEDCGANPHNIRAIAHRVNLIQEDIANASQFRDALAGSDIIFNLAGEISHSHSMRLPERDSWLNATAQLRFLRECAALRPGIRIVFAGTRQIYGAPLYLPVDENHPVQPIDFNGVHKYAACMYHLLWSRSGELDAAVLNLTNVYGPRMAIGLFCQGFLGNFLRRLVRGEPLDVFGDGLQIRDPLYVDDAVEAFLLAGSAPRLPSRMYNIGGPEALPLSRIAALASQKAGTPPPRFREFPPERKAIDIGSYYANSTRIRNELGFRPTVSFEDGIGRSLAYFRRESPHYLDPLHPEPVCTLEAHA